MNLEANNVNFFVINKLPLCAVNKVALTPPDSARNMLKKSRIELFVYLFVCAW